MAEKKKKKKTIQEITAPPVNPLTTKLAEKQSIAPAKAPTKSKAPEIIRDEETGKMSGVTVGGKTYLGLPKEDINAIVSKNIPEPTPAGAVETEDLLRQKQAEAIALKIGQIELTGDVEKDKLSYEQAIKSSLTSTAAGAAGGLAVGLAGGPAAPITVPIGVAVGSIAGFLRGFRANLKTQRADMLKGEASNLLKQEQNLLKIVMNTNQGGDATQNLDYFNEQLSLIAENHARLKLETSDNPSLWLGEDGKRQMEKFEAFYTEGGMHDILVMQMQQAVLNPDPNKSLMGIGSLMETEVQEEE